MHRDRWRTTDRHRDGQTETGTEVTVETQPYTEMDRQKQVQK